MNNQFKNLFFLFLLFCTLVSCKEEESPETSLPAVGTEMEGGILAYLFTPADAGYRTGEVHGIIVAIEDFPTDTQWGCRGSEVGGTSREIGNGRTNTSTVAAFHDNLPDYYNNPSQCHPTNDGTVAAKIAQDSEYNGYNDWFIPTRGEALILYSNREQIGGFSENDYWSSCESNRQDACAMSFVTGATFSADKSIRKKIRLIRYF
ncbi:DUF1566 domain-containing protein [Anditalea andensis]|uniref:DUF1566 domain-containing protein n=1 Tax=Anditalea andensis TaxID=1048983 RepID=A0A074LEQ8_9BACT|nr:DUF1566 domain-containing protein [Anditalea andensis]KEO72277.1 hypothetical protein EL17_16120 [Anditalea andensis]